MKRSVFSLAVALFFAICITQAAPGAGARQQDNPKTTARSFNGVVMDSSCAQMGSHEQMEKQHGMTGSSKLTDDDAKKCTEACVQAGGKYVLYNQASKMTYQLSDQDKAKQYSGEAVKVSGSYDPSSKTITVENIAASGSKSSKSSSSKSSDTPSSAKPTQ